MTDALVVLIVPEVGAIALTPAALHAARALGRSLLGECQSIGPASSVAPAASQAALIDAHQLEIATGISAEWWMTAARERRVPHRRIGRKVRFVLEDVLASEAVRSRSSLSSALSTGLQIRKGSASG